VALRNELRTRSAVASSRGIRLFSQGRRDERAALLSRVRQALNASGVWDELRTDWVLLDCELLPWSAKAQELLRQHYAAVGAAASAALPQAVRALQQALDRGLDVGDLLLRQTERVDMVSRYVDAYGRYCWPVQSLDDLKLAPFHLLASEGAVHANLDHAWHMQLLSRVCAADATSLLLATPWRSVDLTDPHTEAAATEWWQALTAGGGEGMVVRPLDFVARNARNRLVQPALKCRGREYLRLIYGPEYTTEEYLERLRARGVGGKRALAAREFALGVEGLERFVNREPSRRVHECAFGVLALESEPVDPRL